jgi:hypothetical protein
MSLSIHPPSRPGQTTSPLSYSGRGPFRNPGSFTEVFLGAFRRDIQSFYPGCAIEREHVLEADSATSAAGQSHHRRALDFQLEEGSSPACVRVSLFGTWHRLSVEKAMGVGNCDRRLIRAIGRVLELHYHVLFESSRVSLLQLRRGMPEDHYVAACVEPSAYLMPSASPSRIAEAILTLRTLALSTYENRRVTTGALIQGVGPGCDDCSYRPISPSLANALTFGVELTSLKSLHRLCDGRRTLFLIDEHGKLIDLVDIRQWAVKHSLAADAQLEAGSNVVLRPVLPVPCARVFNFHALATLHSGDVCLVLSQNQEIKVFAGGVQAFVFAHGRWRVLDPESKYALWEKAVANPVLARVLFQTALDLAEERQGGLFVVVSDPVQAIGRLIAPHDLLACSPGAQDVEVAGDAESPARPFSLFGAFASSEDDAPAANSSPASDLALPPFSEPLAKRSLHYLAAGASVTSLDPAVLEGLAGLDGALVTDREGVLLAFGAILRHDAHSLSGSDRVFSTDVVEGARTTAALVASRFGPVLKISEDGIVSCFLDGTRVWDL